MAGDGWKWQINKNTFRQRGGKIKLPRGEKLWVTRVHRKRHVRAEKHHFLVGNELKADYHLGGPFFFIFFISKVLMTFQFFFFFFLAVTRQRKIPSELQRVQHRQGPSLMKWMWVEPRLAGGFHQQSDWDQPRVFIRQSNILFFTPPYTCARINMGSVGVCRQERRS